MFFSKRQVISSSFRNFKPFSCRVQYFALLRTEDSLDAVLMRSVPNHVRDGALANPVRRGKREGGKVPAPNHAVKLYRKPPGLRQWLWLRLGKGVWREHRNAPTWLWVAYGLIEDGAQLRLPSGLRKRLRGAVVGGVCPKKGVGPERGAAQIYCCRCDH